MLGVRISPILLLEVMESGYSSNFAKVVAVERRSASSTLAASAMIDKFELRETIGIGRGPVGLEPIFEAMQKPEMMSDHQWNYRKLEIEHGREEARKIVAKRLRELADTVEKDGYPDVFGFTDEDFGSPLPVATLTITMSYPWPG